MSSKKKSSSSAGPPRDNSPEAVKARLRQSLMGVSKDLAVDKFFRALVKLEGSDLHMKVGQPPMVRVGGELKPLNYDALGKEEAVDLLVPMMDLSLIHI